MVRWLLIFALCLVVVQEPMVEGDFNGDGKVDIVDAVLLAAHLGEHAAEYDLDGDGQVTAADLEVLSGIYLVRAEAPQSKWRVK